MFSKQLKQLRTDHQISRKQLAEVVGVSHWAIAKYETGERTPDFTTTGKLATFFSVSVDQLIGHTHKQAAVDQETVKEKPMIAPVIKQARPNRELFTEKNIVDYETVLGHPDTDTYFYISIKEDSMAPLLRPGYLILVKEQDTVSEGDVALVSIEGRQAVARRVFISGTNILLHAENPIISAVMTKINKVKIFGQVIEVKFKL